MIYKHKFFIGKSYFRYGGLQIFLIFQLIFKILTMLAGLIDTTVEWKSKGLLNEKIRPPTTENNSLSPKLRWMNNSKIRVEFKGSSLKQDKVNFYSKKYSKFVYCP